MRIFVDEPVTLAQHFARALGDRVSSQSDARALRIALSGGSVAEQFLPALGPDVTRGAGIEVYFCDERAVDPTDSQSNFKLARDLWLARSTGRAISAHAMYEGGDLWAAAHKYEELLRAHPDQPLDLALLGVGPDGHVASLFPGSPYFDSPRWVEPVFDSPKPPAERLTLTLALFSLVPKIVVGAFGASKAEVIARALDGDTALPLARLCARAQAIDLYLDSAAARDLGGHAAIRAISDV